MRSPPPHIYTHIHTLGVCSGFWVQGLFVLRRLIPNIHTCNSLAIWPCASAMLDLTGLSRMACVAGLGRYSRSLATAVGSGPDRAAFTRLTISANLAGEAKA